MKDLDDFDLHGRRGERTGKSGPELDPEAPVDAAAPAGGEWDGEGPSGLEDDAGGLPELPPDVTPERPLIPPLTYLVLVLVAVPVVLYLLLRPGDPETIEAPEIAATPLGLAPAQAPEPEAPDASPPLELPALHDSDTAVRELLAAVSAHPGFAGWLGQPQLVRTFVVVVENVADGESPTPHLGFLAPSDGFQVRETAAGPIVDPSSFARYDAVTAVVTSLDPQRAARRLRDLEPLTEAAYRELGHPEGGFGDTLRRAIDKLVATPVPTTGARLRRHSVSYAWADPRLEALDPAQKHLLRTGPENQPAIQAWLRSLRAALDPAGENAPEQQSQAGENG
jgi:hypothetical protein